MKTKDYRSINWHDLFVEDYESPTGLRWKVSPAQCIKANDVSGGIWTSKKTGLQYFVVTYNKKQWLIHRILWVMRNGNINTILDIDHIDGNSLNNSVENLRLVPAGVNNRNQKQRSDNASGVTGVCFWKDEGRTYAITQWCNLAGKRESKKFSCDKLGTETAFKLACEYREKMIAELNESGAGYSERHGTIASIIKE